MLSEVGTILIGLGLVTTVYATLAVYRSILRKDGRWWESGRNGVIAASALLGAAVVLLLVGFLNDDFGIDYVAQHSSRALPLYLKVTAIWGGQDGSLLLWAFLQALFGAILLARPSDETRPLMAWATVIMGLITAFFVSMTLFLSNPFAPSAAVPADGQGLNPLLRHPGMVFHPPAMYLGYVGLAVPFALALAALITRRIDDWSAAARSWTLGAWLFLGLGLLLGMRWAYDVLGWGGYWGWDPVENAGLMPWLTATALLHALIMDDRRRGFRWWSMILTVLSFVLVLFGTFTTRSGLIQSVHAFARSPLGPYFLAAMGVTIVASVALLYSRRRLLTTPGGSEDLLSREGMFSLTLILLLTITGSVLIGSVLPTLTQALTDTRFEAGPAWFDRVTGPQLGALVLVMGICPLMGGAIGTARRLGRLGITALIGTVAVPLVALLMGFQRPIPLIGFAVVGLAGGTVVGEIVRGALKRTRHGENILEAVWSMVGRNRRRYGGYLVHLGIILMALGVIGTRFYPYETETVLKPGESVEVGGYSLALEDLQRQDQADHVATCAPVSVYRDGRYAGALTPRLDDYTAYHQTVAVPAVMSSLRQDLYIVLAGWSAGGSQATLKVFINPLASFLWLGGIVFMTGGTIALWPQTRRAHVRARHARRRSVISTAGVAVGLAVLALTAWAMWGRGPLSSASGCTPVESGSARAAASAAAVKNRTDDGGSSASSRGGRPSVGEPAPDFSVELLDGSTFSLSESDGGIAVINFWSPDCKPCKEELPDFQEVWETYETRDVAFVGISLPSYEEDVRDMVAEYDVTYPVALNTLAPIKYGITGVPETFVVDQDGTVAHVYVGPVTGEQLRKKLDALLGGEG